MTARTYLEDKLQASICEYVRTVAPQAIIFAIPNGGLRSKREAAKLKWTGVLAGIPDLVIVAPGKTVGFIEVKTPDGALSSAQREIRDRFQACRIPWAVARSIEDVRTILSAWNIETRETAGVAQ